MFICKKKKKSLLNKMDLFASELIKCSYDIKISKNKNWVERNSR